MMNEPPIELSQAYSRSLLTYRQISSEHRVGVKL